MRIVRNGMLGLTLLIVAPAAAAVLSDGQGLTARPENRLAHSLHYKSQDRLLQAKMPESDKTDLLVQFTRDADPSRRPPPFLLGGPPPSDPPAAGPRVAGTGPRVPPFGPPPPLTRAACHEQLNQAAAMVGYLKSKLRIQPAQKEAWARLESAAEPVLEKMQAACDGFPTDATPPPLPDAVDMMEGQLAARLELIRAVREPLRSLYGLLSAEQREALQPPRPPHGRF